MHMKKIYFIIVFLFSAIAMSCQPTNEQKALALIDNYMKGYLVDYESYEPTLVKIDTAYNNPMYNPNIVSIVKRIKNAQETVDRLVREIDWANDDVRSARSSMAIWDSAYSREFYNIAIEEYNEAITKLNKLKAEHTEAESMINESKAELESIISQMEDGVCGWLITHNYKCNNLAGIERPSQSMFLVNDDFTTIQKAIHEEDIIEFVTVAETLAEILGIELWF